MPADQGGFSLKIKPGGLHKATSQIPTNLRNPIPKGAKLAVVSVGEAVNVLVVYPGLGSGYVFHQVDRSIFVARVEPLPSFKVHPGLKALARSLELIANGETGQGGVSEGTHRGRGGSALAQSTTSYSLEDLRERYTVPVAFRGWLLVRGNLVRIMVNPGGRIVRAQSLTPSALDMMTRMLREQLALMGIDIEMGPWALLTVYVLFLSDRKPDEELRAYVQRALTIGEMLDMAQHDKGDDPFAF